MTDCQAPRHADPEPAAPHANLCRSCAAWLRRDLRRLPELHAGLGELLDPRRAHGPGTGSGNGLPYHEPAAEAMSQIAHDTEFWTLRVIREREPNLWPVRTLHAMCAWLLAQSEWITLRPWAGDMAGALAADAGHARAVLDPQVVTRFPLPAACPRCGQRAMQVCVYHDGDPRPSMVTCGGCGHEWDTTQWLRLGRDIIRERDERMAA